MSALVAVILAAGAGKRVGGPKALLAWPSPEGEIPLAFAHAEALRACGCTHVLVVTRAPLVGALLRWSRPGVDLLASDAPDEQGPAGSLAFAASRLPPARALVITPVDVPPAKAETVRALLAHLDADPALLAVRPRHGSRAGHPVVLRPEALGPYRAPPPGTQPPPLRDHLRALGNRVADIDVPDAAVLLDLDTPVDVFNVLRAPPRFL